MEENEVDKRNIFINSKFSKNINDLFNTEYNQFITRID